MLKYISITTEPVIIPTKAGPKYEITGRRVGFKVKRILDKKTGKISGTNIRKFAKQVYGVNYGKRLVTAKILDLIKLENKR